MLLQAMAETVRAEMVARSITRSPVALLFRLYTMYQPGGESEKAYILQYLVTPPKAQTAVEMVATLRQWERMLLRADNLRIAKPDPSPLVRGLNALVGDVWAKDRDVTFRTQLVKSRLGVDVSPTWESALQLHQHLRAEAENMVHAPTTTTTTTTKPAVGDGQRDPKLRPLQPNQSHLKYEPCEGIIDNPTDYLYSKCDNRRHRGKEVQVVYRTTRLSTRCKLQVCSFL